MIDARVARRYARALIDVASQDGRHEKIGAELEAISMAMAAPEVRDVLTNPAYAGPQRRSVVMALGKRLNLSPLTTNFLSLLVDRQRIEEIEAVARVYRDLLDEKVGRVRAVVTSALPLNPDDLARVRDTLAAATRKSVVLESKTDPAIVGGLVTKVGTFVWDGSLRTQLERLREELKQGPA